MAVSLSNAGLTLGSTTINDWDDASGTVKQVVSASSTSTAFMSNTGGSFLDLSNLSVAITPSSASNKVLVTAHVCSGQAASHPYAIWFRLTRNGTAVGVGNSTNNRVAVSFCFVPIGLYMDDDMGSGGFTFLDTPSTTSLITYKVQGTSRAGGNWAFNMSDDQQNSPGFGQGISTITAMEVS